MNDVERSPSPFDGNRLPPLMKSPPTPPPAAAAVSPLSTAVLSTGPFSPLPDEPLNVTLFLPLLSEYLGFHDIVRIWDIACDVVPKAATAGVVAVATPVPTGTVETDAVRTDAVPADVVRTDAVPADVVRFHAAPSDVVRTDAPAPTDTTPAPHLDAVLLAHIRRFGHDNQFLADVSAVRWARRYRRLIAFYQRYFPEELWRGIFRYSYSIDRILERCSAEDDAELLGEAVAGPGEVVVVVNAVR